MGPRHSPTWFAGALFGAADMTHVTTAWIDRLTTHGFPQPVISAVHILGTAAFCLLSVRVAWHWLGRVASMLGTTARAIAAVHRTGEDIAAQAVSGTRDHVVNGLRRALEWLDPGSNRPPVG